MLNQFYNYLSNKLEKYFEETTLHAGDKFYLQFDERNQVEAFYEVLKQSRYVTPFRYQHSKGGVYTTYCLEVNSIKVVVAATLNVTADYLVLLRNQVTEQVDLWKNTALFVICDNAVDSIYNGMRNVQKEGMPLNTKKISLNLRKEIEQSSLTKEDKEVAKFYLRKKEEEIFQTTLWDYEEILAIINKGTIDKESYASLGLFYDKNLGQYTSKQMEKRLMENSDYFEKVSNIVQFEERKEKLEKIFDKVGVNKLAKEDWETVDFSDVKKSKENFDDTERTLSYIPSLSKQTIEGLTYWEKAKASTNSGERKRNIIVFYDGKKEQISFQFEFDKPLKKEFLEAKYSTIAEISKNHLRVFIQTEGKSVLFKKVVYKHNKQAKSTYEFNILVLGLDESVLEKVKSLYEIDSKNKRLVINNPEDSEHVIFGADCNSLEEVSVSEPSETIVLGEDKKIKISESSEAWDEGKLEFTLKVNECEIPITIKDTVNKSYPVKSLTIWKLKREKKQDFIYNGVKVIQGEQPYYIEEHFKMFLQYEYEIVTRGIKTGRIGINGLKQEELRLSSDMEEAYQRIIRYFQKIKNIPSLVYINSELEEVYCNYIDTFNKEVAEIKENSILSDDSTKLNLLRLGVFTNGEKIYYSSLSPLNVSYQLEIMRQCGSEMIENHLLNRLSSNDLVPYLYGEKQELYRSIKQSDAQEWIMYEKNQNVSLSTTNAFIATVIKEKLNQFISHFPYLFQGQAPIKINLINIKNDKEVVRGIYQFIKEQINTKKIDGIIPVEINIYSQEEKSSFDEFFEYNTIEKIEKEYDIDLQLKQLDALDVLRIVQMNINYYKHKMEYNNEVEYAHISFYKLGYESKNAKDNMNQIETGVALEGILSTVNSNTSRSQYRIGFGTKNIYNGKNRLIETAIHLNELAVNWENEGENPYSKGKTIVAKPTEIREDYLNKLYRQSHWVTFIEPTFGLEYFEQHSQKNNLLIIHYSEQYSSSDQYDTITVTDRSKQYERVIEEYLSKKNVVATKHQIEEAIKLFNSINGDWLLNIIGRRGEYDREKLSVISAIKYGLVLLDHKDILWVPISMEEILRVAGAVKLNRSEGVFTIKNLKQKGVHSDDLLFIGLKQSEERIKVFYYPVEVKVGYNFEAVIDKGKSQIDKTYHLLRKQLCGEGEEKNTFKSKFFRYFFIQVLLANQNKFVINGIWKEKDFDRVARIKEKLMNDEYDISFELEEYIGHGALVSFKKDNSWRTIVREDDKLIIELTEEDAYQGIVKSVQELYLKIQGNETDIRAEQLLSHKYKSKYTEEFEEIAVTKEEEQVVTTAVRLKEKLELKDRTKTNDGRVLIGEIEGSSRKLYWEFSNKGLGNRHLLIQGKSGQGKTYFIQCLLGEVASYGIPSLIIDYTDGFKASKLEPEFKEVLGKDLQQILVAKDKFALNPFRRGEKELDEDLYIPEDNVDIAERFKSVIGAVYRDLGVQQLNCIYQAVINGLNKYGDGMNLQILREMLMEDSSASAKTALAQLTLLIDKNPFDNTKEYDWSEFQNGKGKITIIQLAGFTRDVQVLITEMILWDLWNYMVQYGDKNQPFTVVLDEAQNLNFGEYSPCTRILTEGRKFGWSAWFATQFLKGQMENSEINRLQNAGEKIYFCPPENSTSDIASSFSREKEKKKEWEKSLSELKKGQCVAYGPIADDEGTITSTKPVKVNITSLLNRSFNLNS